MIFVVNKAGKKAWVCFIILLGMLMGSSYFFRAEEAKADRSNAVQVAKIAATEASVKVDFFTEYRLERDKLRSERLELLRENLKGAATEESRKTAQENVLKMVQDKQREAEMESLIKAKGFADALVVCKEASVSAVVKADQLSKDEVVQVADIISRIANAAPAEITISAKP